MAGLGRRTEARRKGGQQEAGSDGGLERGPYVQFLFTEGIFQGAGIRRRNHFPIQLLSLL